METPKSKVIEINTMCWSCKKPSDTYDFEGITSCGTCGAGKTPQHVGSIVNARKKIVAFVVTVLLMIVIIVIFIGGALWLMDFFSNP